MGQSKSNRGFLWLQIKSVVLLGIILFFLLFLLLGCGSQSSEVYNRKIQKYHSKGSVDRRANNSFWYQVVVPFRYDPYFRGILNKKERDH